MISPSGDVSESTRDTRIVVSFEDRYNYEDLRDLVGSDQNRAADKVALRVAPLLSVATVDHRRMIIVGTTCIVVEGELPASVDLRASYVWRESQLGSYELLPLKNSLDDTLRMAVERHLEGAANSTIQAHFEGEKWPTQVTVPTSSSGLPTLSSGYSSRQEHRAALICKALCESSRNAMAEFREIRYKLEDRLALSSLGDVASPDHTNVVAALLQLSVQAGRATDQVLYVDREGLYVVLTNVEAYKSYRRLRDPSMLNGARPAEEHMESWMKLHDAAMRQCEELHRQLDVESTTIRSLIAAAASISSSREADAQTRFNVLAAVVSIGLGLPALVLTLYGASAIVPFNSRERWVAFAPVAVALILASALAFRQGHKMKRGNDWKIGALGIMFFVLVLLLVGGTLVPE